MTKTNETIDYESINSSEQNNENEEVINIRELLDKVIDNWKLFPVAFLICFAFAFVYLKITPSKYEVSSKVLVNGVNNNGGLNQAIALLGGLQMDGGNSGIEDNIEMLKSLSLSMQVVKQLRLNIRYFDNSGFLKRELYGETNPILLLTEPVLQDTIQSRLTINIKKDAPDSQNHVLITYDDEEYTYTTANIDQGLETVFGVISLSLNPSSETYDYIIRLSPITSTAKAYVNRLNVSQAQQWSSILLLSLTDNISARAMEVINKTVELFNENAVSDKNATVQVTASFIDARLKLLSEELGDVEQDVEAYKRQNQLTDVGEQARMFVGMNSEIERRRMDVETQMNIIQSVENFINQNAEHTLVPNNVGVNDATLTAITTKYNELILERTRLLRSTNEDNPVVVELDARLAATKANLISSIKNIKNSIEITRSDIYSQIEQNSSKIGEIPTQERQLVEIKRQQQVKEALFLFLLQKREETTLSLAVNAAVLKTIDPAMTGERVAPKKKIILLGAFMLSFIPSPARQPQKRRPQRSSMPTIRC